MERKNDTTRGPAPPGVAVSFFLQEEMGLARKKQHSFLARLMICTSPKKCVTLSQPILPLERAPILT